MPAPPARSRSASVPCGVSSTSSSPGEVLPLELLVLPDVRAGRPAIRLVAQQDAEAPVVDAAVVRHDLAGPPVPCSSSARDQHARDAAQAEPADGERGAVADVGDGLRPRCRRSCPDPCALLRESVPRIYRAPADRPRASVPRVSQSAGYSGTPLPRKLGIAAGATVLLAGAPAGFDLGDLPAGVTVQRRRSRARYDVVLAFCPDRAALAAGFPTWKALLGPADCPVAGVAEAGVGRADRPHRQRRARGRTRRRSRRREGVCASTRCGAG